MTLNLDCVLTDLQAEKWHGIDEEIDWEGISEGRLYKTR
jgi:hypothetical protein